MKNLSTLRTRVGLKQILMAKMEIVVKIVLCSSHGEQIP